MLLFMPIQSHHRDVQVNSSQGTEHSTGSPEYVCPQTIADVYPVPGIDNQHQ